MKRGHLAVLGFLLGTAGSAGCAAVGLKPWGVGVSAGTDLKPCRIGAPPLAWVRA